MSTGLDLLWYSMVELLAPAAKIVINDDNKQQMYNVEMLPVLEIVLAQQVPGEEKAEEGAGHKIVIILLHLSFINAGLNCVMGRIVVSPNNRYYALRWRSPS
jgi:hypothetical protein